MMNTNFITFILIFSLFFHACNNKQDPEKKLQQLKKKREEINKQIRKLNRNLNRSKNKAKEGELVAVREMKLQPFSHYIHVHGTVESENNISVAPEISGQIENIKVKEGQKVRKGQVLAMINTEMIRQSIEEIKTQLEHARTMFKKQKNLREQNVGTEVDYLNAKNRVERLEKKLQTQKTKLNKAYVKAPVSGYIDEIFPKKGEMISPQMPLLRILNLNEVYIKAEVSEAYLTRVKEGDKVKVEFPMIEKNTTGKIDAVGRYINPNNRTFKIHISVNNKNQLLKPNLLAVVKLKDYSKDSALVVPSNIIQYDKKGDYIYKVKNKNGKNIAVKNYIKSGYVYGGKTLIKDGLNPGEKIITEGYIEINESEPVRWKK